jgi:predicted O-methyltransferase YrrM
MGHNQRAADLNLGLGWLYYGFARLLRPARAVVIGSWRGFVPMVVAKGCQDNLERGEVTFIDPSLVDDFWKDPAKVEDWFARFGLANIRHHCLTTQEFVETDDYRRLGEIGLLVVDGFHTAEQARIDYEAFQGLLAPRALVLFHDSMRGGTSGMYDRDKPYQVSVRDYMEELRADPGLELLDIAYGEGLTVLRKLGPGSDEPLRDPADRPRRSAARPAS